MPAQERAVALPSRDAGAAGAGQMARSALQLTASLLGTWGIAVVVRLSLPRFLGPEQFGVVNFADGLTAIVFVALSFGVDTYIRKEVTLRATHADDFFGILLLVRGGLTVLLLFGLGLVMAWTDQPAITRHAVYLFAVGQFFFVANDSFAALLHARATVIGLSVVNVVTKLLWGGATAVALSFGGGARAVAAAFILSEALRAALLLSLSRRHLGLRLVLRPRAAMAVALASLPFFVSIISSTVCTRIGSGSIGFLASPAEVGFYGAAWTLGGMALLLAPLLSWVLIPFLSQAAAESEEALLSKARRTVELVISLSVPIALGLALGAEVWLVVLFGEAFAPAAAALRWMGPMVVLTHLAMICSTTLILQRRAWAVTSVALGSLILSPVLHVVLVPRGGAWFGIGGPGLAAVVAELATEAAVVILLLHLLRAKTFDRESVLRVAKHLAVCAVVVLVHHALWFLGPWRLVADAGVYIIGVLLTGAFPMGTLVAFRRAVMQQRQAGAQAGPGEVR